MSEQSTIKIKLIDRLMKACELQDPFTVIQPLKVLFSQRAIAAKALLSEPNLESESYKHHFDFIRYCDVQIKEFLAIE